LDCPLTPFVEGLSDLMRSISDALTAIGSKTLLLAYMLYYVPNVLKTQTMMATEF